MEIVSAASEQQIDKSNDPSVDIENPAASLKRELESIQPLPTEFCIYRVPQRLRQSNEKFYTPLIVSIGPLHHGREELKTMEEYKRKCLKDFLKRTEVSLEGFVDIIKKNEARLRNCYADTVRLNSHDFVKMILVDAAFIFEVLLGHFYNESPSDDRVYDKPWLIIDIQDDLFVLENQLPFFILEDLLTLANIPKSPDSEEDRSPSMLTLTHKFSETYWDMNRIKNLDKSYSGVGHFVDYFRKRILPSDSPGEERSSIPTVPSVTMLHQAAVKFGLGSSDNIFDIRFNNGTLEIPLLRIRVPTELILRNLLAFEQCHYPAGFINDYVRLMNFLLNSSTDVDLLVENGIIENRLRDSEGVSVLFHNLVELTVTADDFYFFSLAQDLKKYCVAPWHKWMATLKQDYFNTPWTTISVTAAVILLILTFIQTTFSILK